MKVIGFMLSSFRQQTQQNFSNSFRMSFQHRFKLKSRFVNFCIWPKFFIFQPSLANNSKLLENS